MTLIEFLHENNPALATELTHERMRFVSEIVRLRGRVAELTKVLSGLVGSSSREDLSAMRSASSDQAMVAAIDALLNQEPPQ